MRIAVTGANGLVGRSFQTRLSHEDGIAMNRIVRGTPSAPDETRGPDLESCTADDWRDPVGGADTVVHLAAALPWSGNDAESLHRVNVDGTRALAKAALAEGVRRFVFVSTLGVYGVTSDARPFTPDSPVYPSGAYAQTKFAAEETLRDLCGASGMELVILRPPVVYGLGVGGKIGWLIARIRKRSRLPLGKVEWNRRQMIGANNLADAILLACHHADAPGEPLLPADDEAVSTYAFLSQIAEALDRPLKLYPVPGGALRMALHLPVIGKLAERLIGNVEVRDDRLRDALGWTPPRALSDGIVDMVRPIA